jgi:GTP-binding protein Era
VRSGFVALAGRPNVGKSALVNALCGTKVAIVSDKPQTTRHRIQGVANGPDAQLVLVDLPGFQRPLDAMTERMQRRVDHGLEDVDGVLLVLAADEAIGAGDRFVAARAFATPAPVVIALNKVDRVDPAAIARQIAQAATLGDFRALHPVSAKTGDGVAALRDELFELLPDGPVYFPPGEATDAPLELRIAELIREPALELTRDEVPHAVTVEVEEIEGRRITAAVVVETASQKQILIGKGGQMIKRIGTRARPEIELLLGGPVYLDLRVKVKPRWRRDEALLERLGL